MYKVGDVVFLIESHIFIKKVKIICIMNGYYTIKYESGGGIRVRGNRLYKSEEDAKIEVEKWKKG